MTSFNYILICGKHPILRILLLQSQSNPLPSVPSSRKCRIPNPGTQQPNTPAPYTLWVPMYAHTPPFPALVRSRAPQNNPLRFPGHGYVNTLRVHKSPQKKGSAQSIPSVQILKVAVPRNDAKPEIPLLFEWIMADTEAKTTLGLGCNLYFVDAGSVGQGIESRYGCGDLRSGCVMDVDLRRKIEVVGYCWAWAGGTGRKYVFRPWKGRMVLRSKLVFSF